MASVDLSDSLDRAGWVRQLAAKVATLGAEVVGDVRRAGLEGDEAVVDGRRHVRFRLPSVPIPPELGFLVADLCVNARSCLDMAVHRVASWHAPKWSKPQFPIGNLDAAKADGYYKSAKKHLPAPYFQVIAKAQPYTIQEVMIHVNLTALVIRELSNVNKHRNITPVMHARSMAGFNSPHADLSRFMTFGGGPWDRDPLAVWTLSVPAEMADMEAIWALAPTAGHSLTIDVDPRRSFFSMPEEPWRPVRLESLITKVPAYVDMVLRNFGLADDWVASGETHPLFLSSSADM